MLPPVLLLGGGKMGGAMLAGWVERGLSPSVVVDPSPAAQALAGPAVRVVPDPGAIPDGFAPAAVVLAVKPQQASAALPGLFPPVKIDGKYYVDGALKKTVHATQALEDGVDLLICLNPLVPFHASPERFGKRRIPTLVEGGFPAVMSQTFRSMIHSRLALGFKHYKTDYPNTDIVLIEPDHRDAELFFANTFSYRQRRKMAEHAYQQTRQTLRERLPTLVPMLERHGIALDRTALNDHRRHLLEPLPSRRRRPSAPAVDRLNATLDELQRRLPTISQQAHA